MGRARIVTADPETFGMVADITTGLGLELRARVADSRRQSWRLIARFDEPKFG